MNENVKVVILAGGMPSTISDDKNLIPKPMAEIGGRPILWHIMKLYDSFGLHDFVICGGYQVNVIKEYFKDFYLYQSDITIKLRSNEVTVHRLKTEDWNVTVVDTGITTSTGERIKKVQSYLQGTPFIVTYGDCLSDLHITDMLNLHYERSPLVTMAVARPSGRHQILSISGDNRLLCDNDKKSADAWVNASCYIFSERIFEYLTDVELNESFMEQMAQKDQVVTYRHEGFWSPVETKRDSYELENMWESRTAPWKLWND